MQEIVNSLFEENEGSNTHGNLVASDIRSSNVEAENFAISGNQGDAIQFIQTGSTLSITYSGAGGGTEATVLADDFKFNSGGVT